MDSQEFIMRIRSEVHDSVVNQLLEDLEHPPGRMPPKTATDLSNWLSKLPDVDKSKIQQVIVQATHAAIFGFLCVLDHVRTIESGSNKGLLKLTWEKENITELLNNPATEFLHDIYQGEVFNEVFGDET